MTDPAEPTSHYVNQDPDMKANEVQVGGKHYRSGYQHWDWAIDINLGYLESAATKYITRWRGKNGVQDVEKAIHYLIKAKEAFIESRYANCSLTNPHYNPNYETYQKHTNKFVESNGIVGLEAECIWSISEWRNVEDLYVAIGKTRQLVAMALKASEDLKAFTAGATPKHKQGSTQAAKTGSPVCSVCNGTRRVMLAERREYRQCPECSKIDHPSPFGYEGE